MNLIELEEKDFYQAIVDKTRITDGLVKLCLGAKTSITVRVRDNTIAFVPDSMYVIGARVPIPRDSTIGYYFSEEHGDYFVGVGFVFFGALDSIGSGVFVGENDDESATINLMAPYSDEKKYPSVMNLISFTQELAPVEVELTAKFIPIEE